MKTQTLYHDANAVREAAALIANGLPVAVASETVYGLAADATNGTAVASIYAAKGRPSFNPLIVHILSRDEAASIAVFDSVADRLAAAFWPGPLTLVLPLRAHAGIASLVTAGLSTVALRVPAHAAMRDLITACEVPLAAPSANASGTISPTTAAHVARSLDGRIPLILNSGRTGHGLESTIVKVEDRRLIVLRPGPITAEALEQAGGLPCTLPDDSHIVAPGQLASHYAPRQPVRLNATHAMPGEWLIGFASVQGDATLSRTGDLAEAAANLFAALHEADGSARTGIAVAPVPRSGLGIAINDRLQRAAAPR